ncbi:hypothetical protein N9Y89_00155 [bacterium]|nr:hypothetical protein [bacterium]
MVYCLKVQKEPFASLPSPICGDLHRDIKPLTREIAMKLFQRIVFLSKEFQKTSACGFNIGRFFLSGVEKVLKLSIFIKINLTGVPIEGCVGNYCNELLYAIREELDKNCPKLAV